MRSGWLCGGVVLLLIGIFSASSYSADKDAGLFDDSRKAADLASSLRKHSVKVFIHAKTDNGDSPSVGGFESDISNERPTRLGGYWWDADTVIIEDPVLPDRFIRRIEISPDGEDARYPAEVAGRFLSIPAILLRVLPDKTGLLPKSEPLVFQSSPDLLDVAATAVYGFDTDRWNIRLTGGPGTFFLSEGGVECFKTDNQGILVNEDGMPVGMTFSYRAYPGDQPIPWRGDIIRKSRLISPDEFRDAQAAIRRGLNTSALEVRFALRVRIDEEEEGRRWRGNRSSDIDESTPEVRGTGLVVGPRRLWVPVALERESLARLEGIRVILPDGRELDGRFAGAFRDYQAVLVDVDEDLPQLAKFMGLSALDPDAAEDISVTPDVGDNELFLRWNIDHRLGKRREKADYDRWRGYFAGYRGIPVVYTYTNEENGSMAFAENGRLLAIAVPPRLRPDNEAPSRRKDASASFLPIGFLSGELRDKDAIDQALRPEDGGGSKRLIDLGLEWQRLDINLAKLFQAEKETRGGKIGLLVTYVYPDSPAAAAGLREKDILLSLQEDSRHEPVELVPNRVSNSFPLAGADIEETSTEAFQRSMSTPPWPDRENSLSLLLTDIGEGRRITLRYLRDGAVKTVVFTSGRGSPDFMSAPKLRLPVLGMTVKPVTYEVKRFFRRNDDSGVIVARVEDGGKAEVAGLYAYLIITRINGRPVAGLADFRDQMEAFESNRAPVVELTVEGFGKTRLVKIERKAEEEEYGGD